MWVTDALTHDGVEGAVLAAIGELPRFAAAIARAEMRRDEASRRALAATLLGHAPNVQDSFLNEIFENESARDRRAEPESAGRLESPAVVDSVVFAASGRVRHASSRATALALLRRIFEATLGGHCWNSASYALASLVRHGDRDVDALVSRFVAFAS